MTEESILKRPWWKHWWGIIIIIFLILIGLCVGYFFQQFFKFYGLAKRGELNSSEYSFGSKFLSSDTVRMRYANTPITNLNVATVDDPHLGSEDAKLVIVEFGDFGCPWSREESFITRELATKYGDKISFIYRDFPVDELHPEARLAAEAGQCANDQNNFWVMHDKIYQNNTRLGRADLIGYAREAGLDENVFTNCLDSGKYKDEVQKDYEDGISAGVRGTPTFFFNNRMVEGAIPRDIFDKIITALTE